jgi:methionine-rich copper-binding protein CopC
MLARRLSATLLLATTIVLTVAAPASAHTSLKSSDPAQGASLATPPQQVKLTFSEAVDVPPDAIAVTGPDGAKWTVGTVTVTDAVVTAPVTPTGPAGTYTLAFKVISDDGDAVTGKIAFSLTAAASPSTSTTPSSTSSSPPPSSPAPSSAVAAPAPAAQRDTSSGVPVWVWIVGAVVLLGAGAFAGLRFSRR